MQYAKFVSGTEIKLPLLEDYLEDGITFKDPTLWYELIESSKPKDVSVFKDYVCHYSLVSWKFNERKKIIMSWEAIYTEPNGRVGKLSNDGNIILPNTTETIDGRLVYNYDKLPNSRKIADGWLLIEETPYPNDGKSYIQKGEVIDDILYGKKIKVIWRLVSNIPEMPYDISKLFLKRALINIGKWEEFKTILAQNPTIQEEFNLSVTLKSNDPLVITMIQICIQYFNLSESQIDAILKSCKSDLSSN